MQTDTPTEVHSAERMSCPARLQEPETHEVKKEKKLSRFFHTLAHKLKLSTSPEDDRESLLRHLGFGFDFVAVRLDRVKDVFVRSNEEIKDVGMVVRIEVTLKSRTDVPAQGIFHPGKSSKTYVLARPFEEYRKLRKVIQFCASRKQHESSPSESKHDNHSRGQHAPSCAYCAEVELYVKRCWTQPPLMATAVISQLAVFRKIVLTNSLNYFIHLARSQYPAAADTNSDVSVSDNNGTDSAIVNDASATNTGDDHPASSQQQQESATTPFCQAQAELAILLHDFFQLQTHG